ncbi:MAG: hypothetical protein JRI68_33695 [Deltaproteobacteria bacterium]|nr:hypothetical protein [Deltaproteobacteria bacterium]
MLWQPLPMKLDHVAIYGVPALAGAITAAALLGPGSERPVSGARIYGVMTAGAEVCAVRIHTVAHLGEIYHSIRLPSLQLAIHSGGAPIGRWEGASELGGLAEAVMALDPPLGPSATLRLSADGRSLAEGTITLPTRLRVHGPPAPELQAGPLSIEVLTPRGVAVPPFPEVLQVSARVPAAAPTAPPSQGGDGGAAPDQAPGDAAPDSSRPDRPPLLAATAEGAEVRQLGQPERLSCDPTGCAYRWQLEVTPAAPTVQLALEVRTAQGTLGAWRGAVPVLNGRMWVDPQAATRGELRLRAAMPKEDAFVSVLGEGGRLWGARAELKADEKGFSSGSLPLPALPAGALVVTVSSDLSEPDNTTIAWPLRPALGSVEPRPMVLLADGLPRAVAAEEERRAGARRPAYGLVLAAGLFELFYLWRRGRLTRRRLQDHLRSASETAEGAQLDQATVTAVAGSAPLLWLLLLTGGLVLIFSFLALVAAFV